MWKPVLGYENYFLVSNEGNVKSLRTGIILKPSKVKRGYLTISSRIGGRGGKAICFRIHRMVAEAFLPPPQQYQIDWANEFNNGIVQVNHKDGNKENNHYLNLEWSTGKENSQHSWDMGLSKKLSGFDSPYSGLTLDQVEYIRDNCIRGCKINGVRALAKRFGITHPTVSKVLNGKRY